jgi:hypothetical protein
MTGKAFITYWRAISCVLLLSTCLVTVTAQGQGLQGDDEAIAMARAMIERMGGRKMWADAAALHVIEEVHRPNVRLPYRSESWRWLREPNIWWRARSSEHDRSFARTRIQGWDLDDGKLTRLNERQLLQWLGNWPRNVYVMYYRLAKEDAQLWLVKEQERRFAVLDARSGEKLCVFEVTVGGEILRWSAAFGTNTEEWIYGPLMDFGSIRMPAWGVRLHDGYRFYYREVKLSSAPPPVSFEPPQSRQEKSSEKQERKP